MIRPCDVCGSTYEAKRPTSKYCSGRCRMRASRGFPTEHRAKVVAIGTDLPALEPLPAVGPVEATTLGVLTEAERENSPLGQAALALARRVDTGQDTGAGLAALVRQLEMTLHSATRGAADEASALDRARDELAARRAKRA